MIDTNLHILKIGGGAGIDPQPVLHNLAQRIRQGERWVLVHGASDMTNTLAAQANIPVQTITSPGGHTSRYTNAEMITIYRAAAAAVNQEMAAHLAAEGINAVGLAGPNIIRARRKSAIRAVRSGRPVVIRDDHSGLITAINQPVLSALLDAGLTPVIAPVALGEHQEYLNVDGDLAAAQVAHTLGAASLMILSNVPGLLRDLDDPASVIDRIAGHELARYDTIAQGRMKKKLIAAQQSGTARVILADARCENPIDRALAGAGTHIIHEVAYA